MLNNGDPQEGEILKALCVFLSPQHLKGQRSVSTTHVS